MPPTLARAEIDAIVRGDASGSVRGARSARDAAGLVIRVFRPDVRGIELSDRPSHQTRPSNRVHVDGLYEIVIPTRRARISITACACCGPTDRPARSTIRIATARC